MAARGTWQLGANVRRFRDFWNTAVGSRVTERQVYEERGPWSGGGLTPSLGRRRPWEPRLAGLSAQSGNGPRPPVSSAPGCAHDVPFVGSPRTERPGLTHEHVAHSSVGLRPVQMSCNQTSRAGKVPWRRVGSHPTPTPRGCPPGTRVHGPAVPTGLGVLGPAPFLRHPGTPITVAVVTQSREGAR